MARSRKVRGEKLPCQICGSRDYYGDRWGCLQMTVNVDGRPCWNYFWAQPAIRTYVPRDHALRAEMAKLIPQPAVGSWDRDEVRKTLLCEQVSTVAMVTYKGCGKLMCERCEAGHGPGNCEYGDVVRFNFPGGLATDIARDINRALSSDSSE